MKPSNFPKSPADGVESLGDFNSAESISSVLLGVDFNKPLLGGGPVPF